MVNPGKLNLIPAASALIWLFTACGPAPLPPVPTRAPAPTFTPTAVVEPQQVDPNAVATAQAAADEAARQAEVAQTQPSEEQASTETEQSPTDGGEDSGEEEAVAKAPTEPAPAQLTIANAINVRGGPGTNYNIIAGANEGETFAITGKSADGTWWQIDYQGQAGWVFGQLVNPQNSESVQVAQNIPAPPPTPVPPPPTATPVPQPAQPPPTPKSSYQFNITAVSKCAPQEAGTWFEGRTYINGEPKNGYKVVFSHAPDGQPATNPIQSGPHPGYEGWNTGYYSHIISAAGPRAGTWYVWIVDDNGGRISEIASWQSKGPGGDCNQAAVDFDSRP